jgi:hypothetical protein
MSTTQRILVAALAVLLLLPAGGAAAAVKRPRPSGVPNAQTSVAPNDFQVYNDYASPERTYASRAAVVHYVAVGIDAPPLNDDDLDGVPDYVERVGEAADRALAYYGRRGFHAVLPDAGGPDARPDLYVSRFSPGTLGVAFPSASADGGAFAVISNNLDPSPERSFASVYATVAHELFHLVQFSYFAPGSGPSIPTWILEGTAAALETRVNPELDDLVSAIQLRRWFSATDRSITTQSYGAQLFWRHLDVQEPTLLPALFARLAARPVTGEGQRAVAATYVRLTGKQLAPTFHRFAVSVAADHGGAIEPVQTVRPRTSHAARVAPLSIHYVRPALPRSGAYSLTVTFPHGRGAASATLAYELESDVPGDAARAGRITPRPSSGGRTLTFVVPVALRRSAGLANPLLVVSNGGERPVAYVANAR